jgi:nucleoside-diphosphate-sugar epimerase
VPANSEFVQGSVLDHELINRLFDHHFFDYVYHLAALRTIAAIRIKQ